MKDGIEGLPDAILDGVQDRQQTAWLTGKGPNGLRNDFVLIDGYLHIYA